MIEDPCELRFPHCRTFQNDQYFITPDEAAREGCGVPGLPGLMWSVDLPQTLLGTQMTQDRWGTRICPAISFY